MHTALETLFHVNLHPNDTDRQVFAHEAVRNIQNTLFQRFQAITNAQMTAHTDPDISLLISAENVIPKDEALSVIAETAAGSGYEIGPDDEETLEELLKRRDKRGKFHDAVWLMEQDLLRRSQAT